MDVDVICAIASASEDVPATLRSTRLGAVLPVLSPAVQPPISVTNNDGMLLKSLHLGMSSAKAMSAAMLRVPGVHCRVPCALRSARICCRPWQQLRSARHTKPELQLTDSSAC